jgi:hypothetical protein
MRATASRNAPGASPPVSSRLGGVDPSMPNRHWRAVDDLQVVG